MAAETNREIIERLSRQNQQLREQASAILANVELLSEHVGMLMRLDNPDDEASFDLEDTKGA